MRRIAFSFLLFVALGASLATAASRVGNEWRINTNDTPRQRYPVAALDGHGGALVVWANTRLGILGRRVSLADPNAAGSSEMTLLPNVNLPSIPGEGVVVAHKEPALLSEADGSFWVFWSRERAYLRSVPFYETRKVLTQEIRARRFDAQGAPLGPVLFVGEGAPPFQSKPRVLRTSTGTIAVVWQSDDQVAGATAGDGVFARFLNASGTPLGPAFRVNPVLPNPAAANAALAADSDGRVLVAWEASDGNSPGVYRRLYTAQGVALGDVQRVNSGTIGRQGARPAAGFLPGSGFLVLWQGATGERFRTRIYGQRFDSAGQRIGGEIEVSHGALEYEYDPSIVVTSHGTYFAAWMLWDSSFPRAVRGHELAGDGSPIGEEINVSTFRVDAQYRTSLAADPHDGVLAVWEGFWNRHAGISAQRISE
ncbi:MAG TPA: hypothetical protein VEW48_00235 [Thermoanaerobaculia bacterium]|nr:hypothetical protein [Thermoanaerobaculia bacterium]